MSEPQGWFKIIYRDRMPIRQRRPDGTWGCRGCGSPIPSNRQAWCSRECYRKHDPKQVCRATHERDAGVCQICGHDHDAAKREFRRLNREFYTYESACEKSDLLCRDRPLPPVPRPRKPAKPDYDHIIPFSEGGLTVLENMRTLCRACHKARTAAWHRERVEGKKLAHDRPLPGLEQASQPAAAAPVTPLLHVAHEAVNP